MDRTKTGALIAAARKEQNMTQKELAAALHVSDRAVSKWERGAGFPDISLLEPLADALGLGVLDLLRGERGTAPEPEPTIRQALAFLARQAKERTRRRWSQVLASIALLCLIGVFLPALIYSMGFSWRPVDLDVPVKVYVDGIETGESMVHIEGECQVLLERTYKGKFSIECVEATCREDATAFVFWDTRGNGEQSIQYMESGTFSDTGVEQMLYIRESMGSFGLRLEDGTIIATDAWYVPLLMSDYYYVLRPEVHGNPWD